MATQRQKLKLLYTMKILLERTDENHTLSASDLIKILDQEYGITAERKSIYQDIEALQDFDLDIVQVKGKKSGYYVASRDFEFPELKLLVDIVQASKFITEKKSMELIGKLEKLASREEGKLLNRQVFIYNRPKTENETIYYNVDYIHEAISSNVQIQFQYCQWDMKKKLEPKKNGEYYQVSPWSLTWDDENYYLIAYEEATDQIKHYRVDKMQKMSLVEDQTRLGKDQFKSFDLADFMKKTFNMYGGVDANVTLRCRDFLAGVIIDRFGQNVMMVPEDEQHFHVNVPVAVSSQFYGWVSGIGKDMQIIEPESVRNGYQNYLNDIIKQYK